MTELDHLRKELAMAKAELSAYKEYARRINDMKPPGPLRLTTLTEDIILAAVKKAEQSGYERALVDAARTVCERCANSEWEPVFENGQWWHSTEKIDEVYLPPMPCQADTIRLLSHKEN